MTDHTQEPWDIRYFNHGTFIHHDKEEIAGMYFGKYQAKDQEANAKRIVQCVNAMAGIDDPEMFLLLIRRQLNRMLEHSRGKLTLSQYEVCEISGALVTILALFPKTKEEK